MNEKIIQRIFEVVEKKNLLDCDKTWSKGSITYFEELKKELEEVKEELNSNKAAYLETELADVFWDYLNLLSNLEKEEKIVSDRVFERCLEKYTERISGIEEGKKWADIKENQKKKLEQEQKLLDIQKE